MLKIKPIIIFIISIIIANSTFAQNKGISVNTFVDKNTITIGDIITYNIIFSYPIGFNILEPEKKQEFENWTIRDFKTNKEIKQDKEILTIKYNLTTFTTGQVIIPESVYLYKNDKNEEKEIKTPSIKINVESLLNKYGVQRDIRDIKAFIYVKRPILPWIIGFILFLTATILLILYFRKKKYPIYLNEPSTPPRPAYEIAFEELENLKQSELLKDGKIKEFYIVLVDIIRRFLSGVYSIETLDKTTNEIYAELKKVMTDRKLLSYLKDFLDTCDLVKFAKYRPEYEICLKDWQTARDFIEQITDSLNLRKP